MKCKLYAPPKDGPKVLLWDIETSPILAYVWSLWQDGVTKMKDDWHLLSWSAKWLGDPKSRVMYLDQRGCKDISNDKKLLEPIWKLLDQADIVVSHNGKNFDSKKINARFIIHGMKPPSSYKHIDTLKIAKKNFSFTSNRLEHLAKALKVPHLKYTNRKFNGFKLWEECLKDTPKAWAEMKKYNVLDTLVLEDVYHRLIPWEQSINFTLYYEDKSIPRCTCGSTKYQRNGKAYTPAGVYQRYRCVRCGAETRGKQNFLSAKERKALRAKT